MGGAPDGATTLSCVARQGLRWQVDGSPRLRRYGSRPSESPLATRRSQLWWCHGQHRPTLAGSIRQDSTEDATGRQSTAPEPVRAASTGIRRLARHSPPSTLRISGDVLHQCNGHVHETRPAVEPRPARHFGRLERRRTWLISTGCRVPRLAHGTNGSVPARALKVAGSRPRLLPVHGDEPSVRPPPRDRRAQRGHR